MDFFFNWCGDLFGWFKGLFDWYPADPMTNIAVFSVLYAILCIWAVIRRDRKIERLDAECNARTDDRNAMAVELGEAKQHIDRRNKEVEELHTAGERRMKDIEALQRDVEGARTAARIADSRIDFIHFHAEQGLRRREPPIQALYWILRKTSMQVQSYRARHELRNLKELLERLVIDGVVEDEDNTYGPKARSWRHVGD